MPFSSKLNHAQLKRLNEHKYSVEGTSLFDGLLQPWWNWVVQRVPLWVAPNLITFVGLAINIVTSLVLVYVNPTASKEQTSSWPYLLCAIGLFIYQTLDAIDGKQARRTSSSTPLGELFDHGCDAISTVFVSLAACISLGLGTHPWWMLFQCFAVSATFYCSHWQTYLSGTFRFSVIDVTEGQFAIMALHVITFFYGSEIWYENVPFLDMPAVALLGIVSVIVYLVATCSYLRKIPQGGAGKNGSTVAGSSVFSPAIPLGLVLAAVITIAQKSNQHIYENYTSLYITALGLVLAKQTIRLVVAHMTKSEIQYLDSAMCGPLLLVLNQYFNYFFSEHHVLWACLIWATFDVVIYACNVCASICKSRDIEVFRIRPQMPITRKHSAGCRKIRNRK